MESDLLIAWLLGLATLVGVLVFFSMIWRSWKSNNGSGRLESSGADTEPIDITIGEPDSASVHHHHPGGHHDSHSGFGSDHGFGHFDGGHH